MRSMPSQIELYEEMRLLSSRMAAAARAGDWTYLVELERAVGYLRDDLLATPDDDIAAADLARKHSLIQRILDDDAEVRRHTEPWMERLCQLLDSSLRGEHHQTAASSGDPAAAG
jgi:flagellar protein FliT